MKLLFLIDNLCSGGAEKVLIDILNNINYDKYNIDLLLIRKKGVYLNNVPKNVRVISIYNDIKYEKNNLFYKIYYLLTKIHFKANRILGLKYIFNNIIKDKYDVYIPFLEGACVQLISDSKLSGKKIAWIHTDLLLHSVMKGKQEEKALKNMDKLICVSQASKESLIQKYNYMEKKVTVINNPISIKNIKELSKESFDIEGFENCGIPTFIAVGRLEKVKGHDILLQAHKLLIDEGIKNKVIILGEGSEQLNLLSKIDNYNLNDSFKLIGFKKNPYPYLKKADYFVMSSRYEGYPLSLCEAIVLGKPLITSNFPSSKEILKDGKLGLICKIDDPVDLKNKMKELILNIECRDELKINCNRYKYEFDFSNRIKQIESIIDN